MFAGEVFPEWYWGPIFFMVVFGLPLSAAALAVDFAVRRWVRRLAWLERAGLWVGVLAGGSLAILGGRALIDHVRFERDAKAAVRNLDFKPYATEGLPDGLTEQCVHADDYLGTPVIVSRYDDGPGAYAFSYQQAPREVSLQDGHCSVRRRARLLRLAAADRAGRHRLQEGLVGPLGRMVAWTSTFRPTMS
jgi:hypothetical protein